MEDPRKFLHFEPALVEHRRHSAHLGRRAEAPPRFSLRKALLALTVVLLGMVAWWGQ